MKKILLLLSCVIVFTVTFFKSNVSLSESNFSTEIIPINSTITGGSYHILVVKNNGELFSWGDNFNSALGTDSGYLKSPNEALKVMNNVLYVSTEHLASFAIDKDDILWGWGRSITGIFDKFTKEGFSIYPIKIMNDVSMVSANQTTLVVKKDGSLWGWGAYYYGQLCDRRYNKYFVDGIGNYKDGASFNVQYETEPIKIMDNVVYALSGRTCFAIKEGGSLWGWGFNENGELGDGTRKTRVYPVKIMEDVKFISNGFYAIKNDNSLWTWGSNSDSNENENKELSEINLLPKKIMEDVIFASKFYGGQSVVIKKDKSLWTWGNNNFGQLGDGTKVNRSEPLKVMEDVIYAAGNTFCTLALKKDGSLWLMGMYNDIDNEINKPHKIMEDVMLP